MNIVQHLDPAELIELGGIGLLLLLVFIETGFLVGLLLPGGESLLVTAGLLCGSGVLKIQIGLLVISVFLAAFAGDLVAYTIGGRMKTGLFRKKEGSIFKKQYLDRTKTFYRKYGVFAILFGRFLPIVRTINPLLSGAMEMKYSKFFPIAAVSSIVYSSLLILCSYHLGARFPFIKNYLTIILPLVVLIFVLPVLIHIFRTGLDKRRKRRKHVRQEQH
jgi:membrane-associated protein